MSDAHNVWNENNTYQIWENPWLQVENHPAAAASVVNFNLLH